MRIFFAIAAIVIISIILIVLDFENGTFGLLPYLVIGGIIVGIFRIIFKR